MSNFWSLKSVNFKAKQHDSWQRQTRNCYTTFATRCVQKRHIQLPTRCVQNGTHSSRNINLLKKYSWQAATNHVICSDKKKMNFTAVLSMLRTVQFTFHFRQQPSLYYIILLISEVLFFPHVIANSLFNFAVWFLTKTGSWIASWYYTFCLLDFGARGEWWPCPPIHRNREFNVYGYVHRKNIPIYIQQDATLYSLFISGNRSTCFGWYIHPPSGAQTTVSTASGICHTVSIQN
jgi:hypothetical protein